MKKIITITFFMGIAASLFAGGGSEISGMSASSSKPVEIVYTMVAVPGDPHTEAMMTFKETVERLSGGSIKVITYDSGSLFKQDQEISAIRAGQADMFVAGASFLTDLSPWLSMFDAGYIFKDYDHMTKVLNGPIGQGVFDQIVKEQGIRPLGAEFTGMRQINLVADKEIKTPVDLRGVNLRMPNTEGYLFLGKAMGANPTPIAFSEVYMALQTKTVDGQENPLLTDKNTKFYEVTKSITITNHSVANVWPTINEKKWQSLTKEQQGWVLEGVKAGIKRCDELTLKSESELIDFFKAQGLKVYYADLNAFSKYVLDQYLESDFSKTWDMDLFQKVQDTGK
jgi:tripartite ATP-independent transporter DctP family solute receptor